MRFRDLGDKILMTNNMWQVQYQHLPCCEHKAMHVLSKKGLSVPDVRFADEQEPFRECHSCDDRRECSAFPGTLMEEKPLESLYP